jgi:CubicO group peptidase (beta-lactamase class C family)
MSGARAIPSRARIRLAGQVARGFKQPWKAAAGLLHVASLATAFFLAAVFTMPQAARAADPRAEGGMLSWPRADMVRALGIFVPERMKEFNVPGVSIAIVADGGVVYSGTFGKADKSTDEPVTPATRFEAGELGETVAAYGALGMMRDKLLFLDAPLSRDLQTPWLRDADDNAEVTLRQVLTNTSGLGDNAAHPSRVTGFQPGSRFSHSGVGFLYLQHVMEAVSGAPFEQVMDERVFKPLGMDASSYVRGSDHAPLARGYVPVGFLLTSFYLPFAIAFIVIVVLLWGLSYSALQRRVEPVDMIWPAVGGLFFAVGMVWWGLGAGLAFFVIGVSVFYALGVAALGGFIYYLGYIAGIARSREGVIDRGRGRPESVVAAVAVVLALLASVPIYNRVLRVPVWPFLHESVSAATSFRTTAPDMARFMIEIVDGTRMGDEMHRRMLGERVPVGGPFFWCLGLGIRDDKANETLWARGSATGFESLMVMDPSRRSGVVVLTNSREGAALAQEIARNVLGLEAVWSLP